MVDFPISQAGLSLRELFLCYKYIKYLLVSIFIPNFNLKFNILNMTKKKLNRLKLVSVEKDKTGVWLAEQLGVTAVTVSKWCNNVTQPTLPTLDKIAELLDCELRDLIIE
jgi:DNA-binding Xre family transcriptional regulator